MRAKSHKRFELIEDQHFGIAIAHSGYTHSKTGDLKMTEQAKRNSIGLSILGFIAGILALMSFVAFYITGEDAGNYYYLGMFFTSLNIAVLCLCFGQVYDLLRMILIQLEK